MIIDYIHNNYPGIAVILDAKRGDIGATAGEYAKEAFERFQADAVTVNPYMGGDTLLPFTNYHDKGVIVLCKTSNAGSGELQNMLLNNGKKLFEQVAYQAANNWNTNKNILLVVGATYPEELANIRKIVGPMPLLIPGIGAQGGDLKATLQAGLRADGLGLIISLSRSIIYAGNKQTNFQNKAEQACLSLKTLIQKHP